MSPRPGSRFLAALAVMATAVTLVSCTSTSVSTTAETSVGPTSDPTVPSGAPAATVAAKPIVKPKPVVKPKRKPAAHIGSTIVLKDDDASVTMKVMLVKVDFAARSTDDFSTPDKGSHYVAVQFRLFNSASSKQPYDDAPSNGVVLIDSEGQQFESDIVSDISSGPMFPATVKIIPGGVAKGYIVFQVPVTSKITAAQFALSSGFGNTGQWKLVK